MTVQAKFRCFNKSDPGWNEPACVVRLCPVYGESEENKQWSKYTPAGYLEMTITNMAASDQFKLEHEYLLTFEDVTE